MTFSYISDTVPVYNNVLFIKIYLYFSICFWNFNGNKETYVNLKIPKDISWDLKELLFIQIASA